MFRSRLMVSLTGSQAYRNCPKSNSMLCQIPWLLALKQIDYSSKRSITVQEDTALDAPKKLF